MGEATDEEVVCFHCRIAAVRKHTRSHRPFTAAIYGEMQRPRARMSDSQMDSPFIILVTLVFFILSENKTV